MDQETILRPSSEQQQQKKETATNNGQQDYYNKGSQEVAEVNHVTIRKLEQRRKLTQTADKLVIVLVGLPGRGKSFISRKLSAFLTWRGAECKVFNVGKYRREHAKMNKNIDGVVEGSQDTGGCHANFFDATNKEASNAREAVAKMALEDLCQWIHQESELRDRRVAIFDATNSTKKRRDMVLDFIGNYSKDRANVGVIFVESVCDDQELLEENFKYKVKSSPDFDGMSYDDALNDLRERVRKYEEQYETVDDDHISYIKVFNLSTKLLANNIFGRTSKTIVPALMMWHVGTRPIYFVRSGKTVAEDIHLSGSSRRILRGDSLGEEGIAFRDALQKFITAKGEDYMIQRAAHLQYAPSLTTGTSVSGSVAFHMLAGKSFGSKKRDSGVPHFPLMVMSSTMPRAIETVSWEQLPFPIEEYSNLNPLDKGDYSGMELEEIKLVHPNWYAKLEKDPFKTRFPGGESYSDLVYRLESCLIDMEQQVGPVVVCSHVSTIQVLLAYFRNTPVEECTSIEVPIHTVIEMSPLKGAGWKETQYRLMEEDDVTETSESDDEEESVSAPLTPIWGDHKKPAIKKGLKSSIRQISPMRQARENLLS